MTNHNKETDAAPAQTVQPAISTALAPFDPSAAPEIVRHEFRKRGTSDAWNECSELIYKFYQCQANDAGYEVRALAVVPAPPEERK